MTTSPDFCFWQPKTLYDFEKITNSSVFSSPIYKNKTNHTPLGTTEIINKNGVVKHHSVQVMAWIMVCSLKSLCFRIFLSEW